MDIPFAGSALVCRVKYGEILFAQMRRSLYFAVENHAAAVLAHDVLGDFADLFIGVTELLQTLSDDGIREHHVAASGELLIDDM